MHATFLVLLGLLAQANPSSDAPATATSNVVIAVCPDQFREALAPWVAYRKGQGYDVRIVTNEGTPEQIRQRIRDAAGDSPPGFLVLVGDVATDMKGQRSRRMFTGAEKRCIPAPYVKAKVNIRWGSEPDIINDAWYADWDGDDVPDIAQGRITADTPEDLATIVAKILAYERSSDFRPWRRELNFVAGVGGFGALADMAIESATRFLLTSGIPADYQVRMTQANWRAPYCPDPRKINQATVDRLNDGAVFWTYIGHGHPWQLGSMRVPGRRYRLLDTRDAPRLKADAGPSVALFLACYVGAIDKAGHPDAPPDCLAEELLRQPGGPVGVVASSRVAMPYAMAVMGMEMMDQCFRQRCPTLGEAVLRAKRSLVAPPQKTEVRSMLDSMAALVSPSPQLDAERAEHVVLFNLIGDPCLRLRYPQPMPLAVAVDAAAPGKIVIEGDSPIAGRATVELVRPLGQLGFPAPRRTKYPKSSDALAEYDRIYEKANDQRVSNTELRVTPGTFRAELALPEDLTGQFQVRAFVEGKDGFASGSTTLRLGPSPEDAETSPKTGKDAA